MLLILMIAGGMVAIYFIASLLEWAIFKRVANSAPVGITLSVVTAAGLAIILYGFGGGDGEKWNPLPGGVAFVLAGAIVWALKLGSYRRRAAAAPTEESLEKIFE